MTPCPIGPDQAEAAERGPDAWPSGPLEAKPQTWEHMKRRYGQKYPQLVPSLIALVEVDERAWRAGWLR